MTEKIIFTILEDIIFFSLLMLGGYVFGKAFYKIYKGEPVFARKSFSAVENVIFKCIGTKPKEEMTIKKYVFNLLLFSVIGIAFSFAFLMLQSFFVLNPNGVNGMSWDLAFNTAISFVTNTNWQAYAGETGVTYLSQMLIMTVQNFVSGAVGIAVLFALIRGFARKEKKTIGNFWSDIIRIILFMLPICFIGAICLIAEGVPQTMLGKVDYSTLEGGSASLLLGPAASQIIIKQLFTNGGGFFGLNSAFPFENPTAFTNLLQSLSLLLIPVGLCFTFGFAFKNNNKDVGVRNRIGIRVREKSEGVALLKAMSVIFIVSVVLCTTYEFLGGVTIDGVHSLGNMEGKETRFGVGSSALWAVATTAASNGSVNAMHDSFTSIGGMVPLFLMMLGEIVYGGVGSGLYGMIGFAILTVFIAGLMVGRTPEYLGKKIGSFDMKMVCLIILTPVLCLLIGTASTVMLTIAPSWLTNDGAHGFSEILYAFASLANNNGSAFAGFAADTTWTNVVGGFIMLLVRFVPMTATLFLANNLSKKKITPKTDGTLITSNTMFVVLLIFVILIIGALSFFPALALGPIAESLT